MKKEDIIKLIFKNACDQHFVLESSEKRWKAGVDHNDGSQFTSKKSQVESLSSYQSVYRYRSWKGLLRRRLMTYVVTFRYQFETTRDPKGSSMSLQERASTDDDIV